MPKEATQAVFGGHHLDGHGRTIGPGSDRPATLESSAVYLRGASTLRCGPV